MLVKPRPKILFATTGRSSPLCDFFYSRAAEAAQDAARKKTGARAHILKCAVLAALTIGIAPANALAAPAGAPAVVDNLPALPSSRAVERFNQAPGNRPIWFRGGTVHPAAAQLIAILHRAHLDGLSSGPRIADEADAAITRARAGSPAAIGEAERLLSSAWVHYVQALRSPSEGIEYGDKQRVPRIPSPDLILHQAATAPSLQQHLRSVSNVNSIYAELRDAAWKELQLSTEALPMGRVMANLDRARMLPSSGRFVLVNVATARLSMYEDGQVHDSMRVIVGKPNSTDQTPLIASTIYYATLKPYWHVPPTLVRKLTAPNVLRKGFGYLRSRGYQVVSGYTANPRIIPPQTVDWKAVAAGRKQVLVRQLPGPANSMGNMKFSFPNGSAIYLHDTPLKSLFDKPQRTLSAGCIRLEDAPRFARWLLRGDPEPSGAPEQHVQLPSGVPIYVTYLTARVEDGQLSFLNDVYGLDAKAASSPAAAH